MCIAFQNAELLASANASPAQARTGNRYGRPRAQLCIRVQSEKSHARVEREPVVE